MSLNERKRQLPTCLKMRIELPVSNSNSKNNSVNQRLALTGDPAGTRTQDLQLRRLLLYPTELRNLSRGKITIFFRLNKQKLLTNLSFG